MGIRAEVNLTRATHRIKFKGGSAHDGKNKEFFRRNKKTGYL